ncbi:hydroxymethylglutaryl-CoA lyase [Allosphingosinicella deserti]|uniref:Hydroxymethylglutaryl-CoA lyase n=1 Tax=Allosphingosinicella deserti TaxID=2116704 RepID=A0A2P7QZQ2_9SPHN|nr:hydroxymethylglutaryl-CoA lyase [Sphingomonas deserti]PSJ43441.1 hydroxymethylglutaryl-CoA lyase [Sphingomonas deserti]
MTWPTEPIRLQEVSPRDGLQIEPRFVATADKIHLINGLSAAGFTRIEVSSFVSPRAVPALADAADVFSGIKRQHGVIYVALVPNLHGAERALQAGANELNMVVSASETHNRANMRMTPDESLAAFSDIARAAEGGHVSLNGTVATAFGCPFEGAQSAERVLALVDRLLALGCNGITLADTTGVANPRQVETLVGEVLQRLDRDRLTLHFHNTRGVGLANLLAGYQAGVRRFDASLGGLGGCPFAPGAAGNICTEDAAAMCEAMRIPTGLDIGALIALSRTLPQLVGHDVPGQVAQAGCAGDLHPIPVSVVAA